MTFKKTTSLSTFAGLMLFVGGCTSPDLKPFADSTASLHQATVQTRDIIKAELREFKEQEIITNGDALAKAENIIPPSFDARIKFMEAVVDYSDSLAAISDAAKNGKANAQALGDSVKQLADSVGPYGAAVGEALPIFVTVAGTAEEAWAVHSLREATRKAQPIIQRGAEIMESDMKNVRKVIRDGGEALLQKMDEPYENDLHIRRQIIRLRNEEAKKLLEALKQDNQGAAVAAYNTSMAEYDKALEGVNKWYEPLQKNKADVAARLDEEAQMVQTTLHGFQQWAKVHADLAKALEENRQPNLRELISTVMEIKTEIETIKNH